MKFHSLQNIKVQWLYVYTPVDTVVGTVYLEVVFCLEHSMLASGGVKHLLLVRVRRPVRPGAGGAGFKFGGRGRGRGAGQDGGRTMAHWCRPGSKCIRTSHHYNLLRTA